MYYYVTRAQVTPYKTYCRDVLTQLQKGLRETYDIRMQIVLIGSGASNLVTRKGKNGPFDLDYNLLISRLPKKYVESPGKLKDLIRHTLDGLIGEPFSCGKDSTSSIKYLIHENGRPVFSFDLAILYCLNGKDEYSRLIHDKKQCRFLWNIRSSFHEKENHLKAKEIHKKKASGKLRNIYLEKKNRYLGDDQHPSCVTYIEAVNEVYDSL